VEVVLMARSVEHLGVRVLLLQMMAHGLIFAGQNAGNLTERALLTTDSVPTTALGLSWTAFCLLSAFTNSLVNACPLVVRCRTGNGDESGARATVGQVLFLAAGGGMLGLAVAVAGAVAAAAQAVGRRDARELACITWLGHGLPALWVGALPWGAYALCGRQTLAWRVGGSPESQAVLAAFERFMGLLAIFFVCDIAITFLSALLRAAEEERYLLKITAATAAGFGILVIALPLPPDGACLMGTCIRAQAARVVLLLMRVVTRWPCVIQPDLPVTSADDCPPSARSRNCQGQTRAQEVGGKSPADGPRLEWSGQPGRGSGPILLPESPQRGAPCDGSPPPEHRSVVPHSASPCAGVVGRDGSAHVHQIAR
jgi:hypothetical protein